MSGVVTRRGRWKTVCARGAHQALLGGSARGPSARPCVISSASAAFVADAAAVKGEVPLRPRAGFALRKPRAHSRLDEGVL